MKRIFIILCLITICGTSYADIASTGYVDSVAATKQDTISDIETIRTGAGLGATAVQPSSLSTVATSGSYNDLSNKPTIPSLPTGPSGGWYNLVWNGNTGNFVFELVPGSCPSGTYDIGFSQCIDVSKNGKAVGYIKHDGGSSKAADYGLTENGTWGTTLYTGDKVTGIASCNSTPGSTKGETTTEEFSQSSEGKYCWCKMTSPSASLWVFNFAYSSSSDCAGRCAEGCGGSVRLYSTFRSGVFGSVGQ